MNAYEFAIYGTKNSMIASIIEVDGAPAKTPLLEAIAAALDACPVGEGIEIKIFKSREPSPPQHKATCGYPLAIGNPLYPGCPACDVIIAREQTVKEKAREMVRNDPALSLSDAEEEAYLYINRQSDDGCPACTGGQGEFCYDHN